MFSRKHVPRLEPLYPDSLVESSANDLKRLVGEQIELKIELGASDGVIMADPVEVEQILINLVSNARDAMPEGGILTIRTESVDLDDAQARRHHPLAQPGSYVRIWVEDTGVGMDESTKARIFEPFFTTKAVGEGTGLGLATVFAMVKQMQGNIDVRSEPGRGTSIALCFGRTHHEAKTRKPKRRILLEGRALLVEDDPELRDTTRTYLEELGLEVVEAGGADEALKLAETFGKALDVVVTNVVMQGTNGPELFAALRARHPGLRALYVSAHPKLDLTKRGVLEEGAPFLQKPFDKDGLGLCLQTILRTRAPARERTHQTILLVEDNKIALHALEEYLEAIGYRVRAFSSSVEALHAAQEERDIALLLSDVKMPEIQGDELARRLRQVRPDLPVVFMSGLVDPDIMPHATYAKKPIDLDDLEALISATLSSAKSD
jgi:CheY-like chemotaxis protein